MERPKREIVEETYKLHVAGIALMKTGQEWIDLSDYGLPLGEVNSRDLLLYVGANMIELGHVPATNVRMNAKKDEGDWSDDDE